MSHSEGHSSTEPTILWIILPATIAVSLYFTFQSHGHEFHRTTLNGNLGDIKKKEVVAPKKSETPVADTLHMESTVVKESMKVMEGGKEEVHAPVGH